MQPVRARKWLFHQHLAAMAMAEADYLLGEKGSFTFGQTRLADLHQFQPSFQAVLEKRKHSGYAQPRRIRDCIFPWERERSEHRRVGRQHRLRHGPVEALPGERL